MQFTKFTIVLLFSAMMDSNLIDWNYTTVMWNVLRQMSYLESILGYELCMTVLLPTLLALHKRHVKVQV